MGLGEFTEAESLLVEGYDGLKASAASGQLREAIERLVHLYEAGQA